MAMTQRSTLILPAAIALVFLCTTGETLLAQPWAKKMFKEFSHDFGNVVKGERPVHKFQIENVFQEDIHIAESTPAVDAQPSRFQKTF